MGDGPKRTCVGCRESGSSHELVRLVASPDGEVVVDVKGTLPGRGAWLHVDPSCVDRGARRLGASLRVPLTVDRAALLDAIRASTLAAIRHGISLAAAGGGLASGRAAVGEALAARSVSTLLIADDASERVLRDVDPPENVPVLRVPWTSEALGALQGRSATAVCAVLHRPAAVHLVRQLRRLRGLG